MSSMAYMAGGMHSASGASSGPAPLLLLFLLLSISFSIILFVSTYYKIFKLICDVSENIALFTALWCWCRSTGVRQHEHPHDLIADEHLEPQQVLANFFQFINTCSIFVNKLEQNG